MHRSVIQSLTPTLNMGIGIRQCLMIFSRNFELLQRILGANSILRRVSKLPEESGRHALTLSLTLTLPLTLSLTLSPCRSFTDTA